MLQSDDTKRWHNKWHKAFTQSDDTKWWHKMMTERDDNMWWHKVIDIGNYTNWWPKLISPNDEKMTQFNSKLDYTK